MTADHPIAPPPELVQRWRHNANLVGLSYEDDADQWGYEYYIATRAAQWGWDQREPEIQAVADQELEACCEQLDELQIGTCYPTTGDKLRAARRPKPPNLKEQALAVLLYLDQGQHNERCLIIRRALEALPDE